MFTNIIAQVEELAMQDQIDVSHETYKTFFELYTMIVRTLKAISAHHKPWSSPKVISFEFIVGFLCTMNVTHVIKPVSAGLQKKSNDIIELYKMVMCKKLGEMRSDAQWFM